MRVLALLPRILTALTLLTTPVLTASTPAACTRLITARPGDTCASIAAAAGITVAQFIRGNLGIATCSSLTAGSQYCVDPSFLATATATTFTPTKLSTSTISLPTTTPLQVTPDGQCGNGLTCLGSTFGQCCSAHGWCGRTSDHCGDGCLIDFGLCGEAGIVPSSSSSSPVSTTMATAGSPGAGTVVVTQTQRSVVFTTSTVTTIKTITITNAAQCSTLLRTTSGVLPRETVGGESGQMHGG
ncbi:hypothetical protein B0T17DRAFT_535389 [Bombardia bombarda]|uniref:Carbohydrate-binding module family 18 protein n=1 Tax=Bombardia bombarda TaxID=252184 RepID=A0AA39WUR4_9PEZI|nr:hypothetical protein B0T17DRAFT_535389 [Bombardia bombarda]